VGKSSLINALVGYRRAIVHATAGTTRDVVSATTAIDGWPVELSDTAGLRQAEPAGGGPSAMPDQRDVNQAAVELAQRQLAEADLVVLVFDESQPWSRADQALWKSRPEAMVVHNKCDLPRADEPPRPEGLVTSALTGEGVERLVQAIGGRLVPEAPRPGAAVPFAEDQIAPLEAATTAVSRGDFRAALAALDRLAK
jgi:tRNA modification GTPase